MVKTTNIQKLLICLLLGLGIFSISSENAFAADNTVYVEVDPATYEAVMASDNSQEILALLAQQQTEAQQTEAQQTEAQQVAEQQAAQAAALAAQTAQPIPTPAPLPTTFGIMPTVADMDNPANEKRFGQVAGTDPWNDLIYAHCTARGIDPVFVKAIMTIESGGQIDAKNGSFLGLYQVGKAFGYDSEKMLSDADYQTEAAIDVIESKIMTAINLELPANVYYVAKFYNGSSSYAKAVSRIYEDLIGIEGAAKTNLVKSF